VWSAGVPRGVTTSNMQASFDIWPYRHLIAHKAWADFRADSQRNYLGVAWWLLDPIINTFIYYLVFGVFMRRGEPDFVPYLVTGIIGWFWFFQGVVGGSGAIYSSVNLLRQVAINRAVFPLSRVITATYKFGFSLIVLFGALLIYGYHPTVWWLLLPVIMVVEFMLIAAVSLLLASVVPFVPDLSSFIPYALRLGFFLSCVMYKLEWLSPRSQFYLKLNPMVHVLNSYRNVLMYEQAPHWGVLAGLAAAAVVVGAAGMGLIIRLSGLYAKRIMQ